MMRSTVRSQDPSRNTEKGCCTKFSLRTAASPFAPAAHTQSPVNGGDLHTAAARKLSLQRLKLRPHDALVRLYARLIERIHIRELALVGNGHRE